MVVRKCNTRVLLVCCQRTTFSDDRCRCACQSISAVGIVAIKVIPWRRGEGTLGKVHDAKPRMGVLTKMPMRSVSTVSGMNCFETSDWEHDRLNCMCNYFEMATELLDEPTKDSDEGKRRKKTTQTIPDTCQSQSPAPKVSDFEWIVSRRRAVSLKPWLTNDAIVEAVGRAYRAIRDKGRYKGR